MEVIIIIDNNDIGLPQLCVQHAHKETQRRPSPGADRTIADQGGRAGDDDHLDQSDQRS